LRDRVLRPALVAVAAGSGPDGADGSGPPPFTTDQPIS